MGPHFQDELPFGDGVGRALNSAGNAVGIGASASLSFGTSLGRAATSQPGG